MNRLTDCAAALRKAYCGEAMAPLRDWLDPLDSEGAYQVQAINTREWAAAGHRAVGYKIGLTSPAARTFMGTDEPDYGVLRDDMRVASGSVLAADRVKAPRIEGEIALVLGDTITDPAASDESVAAAVAAVHAAIEICDSRIADWKITLADTIADNGSAGFFVLSDEGLPMAGIDLAACAMEMRVNGEVAARGTSVAGEGGPLSNLAWLARKLAGTGRRLCAGDIVLTGSLGAIVPVRPGDKAEVAISNLGACTFTLV